MSILIDMEMPKACVFCELYDGQTHWCRGAKKEIPYSLVYERADDCPLVELPPHGRLVDADALRIDLIDRGIADIQTSDWYEIRQAVDDAPTIIEAEVET